MRVQLIGIGMGAPGQLTLQAVQALRQIDVFLIPDKGDEKRGLKQARLDLLHAVRDDRNYRIVEFSVPVRDRASIDYADVVRDWHERIADLWSEALRREIPDGQIGGLLVWGDPSLFDSTLRILDTLRGRGLELDVEVFPGITAVQALCAAHRVPVNAVGEPLLITTGRRLAARFPADVGSVAVMLDGETAFMRCEDETLEIFWGAYLQSADEILISGRLGEVKHEILARRRDARARKGWIMDTYLLRRATRARASRAS